MIVLFGHIAGDSYLQATESVDRTWVAQNLTSIPLAFTQSMGQWDERALLRADAGGAALWLCKDRGVCQFTHRIPRNIDI